MGLAKFKTKISVEDYLAGEEISQIKYEYVHGEVYAMAETSYNHNRIIGNLYATFLLRNSRCEPFVGDVKLRVNPNIFYYPDIFISCEENPENSYYRNNPILIVEVLSPSTQEIDCREKLHFYQQIPSVLEYVVVEQERKAIEIHRRQPDGRWITYYFDQSDEDIEFQAIEMTVPLDEIYRRVRFEN